MKEKGSTEKKTNENIFKCAENLKKLSKNSSKVLRDRKRKHVK